MLLVFAGRVRLVWLGLGVVVLTFLCRHTR